MCGKWSLLNTEWLRKDHRPLAAGPHPVKGQRQQNRIVGEELLLQRKATVMKTLPNTPHKAEQEGWGGGRRKRPPHLSSDCPVIASQFGSAPLHLDGMP